MVSLVALSEVGTVEFRLKRSETKTESETSLPELDESREIKTVNNKPAESDTLTGPAIFSGAFSNALGMVSLSLERCFDYRLVPAQQLNGARAIVIEYSQSDAVFPNFADAGGNRLLQACRLLVLLELGSVRRCAGEVEDIDAGHSGIHLLEGTGLDHRMEQPPGHLRLEAVVS